METENVVRKFARKRNFIKQLAHVYYSDTDTAMNQFLLQEDIKNANSEHGLDIDLFEVYNEQLLMEDE